MSTAAPQSALPSWLDMDSPQRMEAIRRVYEPGMSLSHIASRIADATRNGVVGYFHRNPDLMRDCPLNRAYHVGSKKSRPRPIAVKLPKVKMSKPLPEPKIDPVEPVSLRIT